MCMNWQRSSSYFSSSQESYTESLNERSVLQTCACRDGASLPTFPLVIYERETNSVFGKQTKKEK